MNLGRTGRGEASGPGCAPAERELKWTALPHGGQAEGGKTDDDDSTVIYVGPKVREGYGSNWLESVPGESRFMILRIYGPLKPWLKQTGHLGEVEPVKESLDPASPLRPQEHFLPKELP